MEAPDENCTIEKEDEWEVIESDDEEDKFFLDPEGRVPFAGNVDFAFRSFPEAMASSMTEEETRSRVVADCQAVFSVRAMHLEYSTGETFWVQADAKPRNCLETMALDIFKAHTCGARFNSAKSGAEWWTQVIEDSDDIGWHWDKDYAMETAGVNVHPCLATVTYLSSNGGPTVILQKQGPMECEDEEGVEGEAPRSWVSHPSIGKHISFDGRYLHAAPADMVMRSAMGSSAGEVEQAEAGVKRELDGGPKDAHTTKQRVTADETTVAVSGRLRVTFLVNVWLNHKPSSAVPLPETTANALSKSTIPLDLGSETAKAGPLVCINVEGTASSNTSSAGCGSSCTKLIQAPGTDLRPEHNHCTSEECSGHGKITPEENSAPHGQAVSKESLTPEQDKLGQGKDTVGSLLCSDARDMQWVFGEAGRGADKQVHERYKVVMPVPKAVMVGGDGGGVKDGASFVLEFGLGRRACVSMLGDLESSEEESRGSSSDEDESGSGEAG
ncbi:unnamed protein product [Choristocarpus tenellus]